MENRRWRNFEAADARTVEDLEGFIACLLGSTVAMAHINVNITKTEQTQVGENFSGNIIYSFRPERQLMT